MAPKTRVRFPSITPTIVLEGCVTTAPMPRTDNTFRDPCDGAALRNESASIVQQLGFLSATQKTRVQLPLLAPSLTYAPLL